MENKSNEISLVVVSENEKFILKKYSKSKEVKDL